MSWIRLWYCRFLKSNIDKHKTSLDKYDWNIDRKAAILGWIENDTKRLKKNKKLLTKEERKKL